MAFLNHDEVRIVWRTGTSLTAFVRDAQGDADVHWTADGWSCSCVDEFGCSHILAGRSIAAVAT